MATHSSTLTWKIPWMVGCSRWSLEESDIVNDFTFTFHFHALEKEMAAHSSVLAEKAMATHSSVLAWKIPGTGNLVGCCLWGPTESDTTEAT